SLRLSGLPSRQPPPRQQSRREAGRSCLPPLLRSPDSTTIKALPHAPGQSAGRSISDALSRVDRNRPTGGFPWSVTLRWELSDTYAIPPRMTQASLAWNERRAAVVDGLGGVKLHSHRHLPPPYGNHEQDSS